MIGFVKDAAAMPDCAAGGPRPGPRLPTPAAGSRPWRPLLVLVIVATMLAPLGVIATGCSAKPAAKKKAAARKPAQTATVRKATPPTPPARPTVVATQQGQQRR